MPDFFPPTLPVGQYKGHQYALPVAMVAQPLYLSTDLFKASGLALPPAGWKWDDFAAIAKKLIRVGSDGKGVQWGWQNTSQFTP